MVYGELSKNRKLKISTIPKQAAETSLVSPLWLFISRRIKHSWSLRSLHGWLATKTLQISMFYNEITFGSDENA